MNEFFWGAVVAIPAGVIGGILGVLLIVPFVPRKKCPDCGALLPRMRNTLASWKPWVCPECGCGVDARGRKVED